MQSSNPNQGMNEANWQQGADLIAEDEARYEQQVANAFAAIDEANFLNNAIASGTMTGAEAAGIAAGNPKLEAHVDLAESSLGAPQNTSQPRISPCLAEPFANSREVLLVARSIGGENGVARNEGHAALVFNAGTNDQPDHYLVQAGPNEDGSTLVGSVRQASAGWWQTYREAEGANWTTKKSMQVPVEVDAKFYLPARLSTVSHFGRITNSFNARKQEYNYDAGPNSNTFIHQFINKLCGPSFTVAASGSMPLKGW